MDHASGQDARLLTELALLESMYPDQMKYEAKGRELSYMDGPANFHIRLPEGYPQSALPWVLSANIGQLDRRDVLKQQVEQYSTGEEIIDSIISGFQDLVGACAADEQRATDVQALRRSNDDASPSVATVVIWLHHLLNTNKRKLALSPPSAKVSGVTKPGYPGVLIYSGPADVVHDHVQNLKQQNWQAFQVRLESDERWSFAHGAGVTEVEAMKDVVAEVGSDRKEMFLEAMRMR